MRMCPTKLQDMALFWVTLYLKKNFRRMDITWIPLINFLLAIQTLISYAYQRFRENNNNKIFREWIETTKGIFSDTGLSLLLVKSFYNLSYF